MDECCFQGLIMFCLFFMRLILTHLAAEDQLTEVEYFYIQFEFMLIDTEFMIVWKSDCVVSSPQ